MRSEISKEIIGAAIIERLMEIHFAYEGLVESKLRIPNPENVYFDLIMDLQVMGFKFWEIMLWMEYQAELETLLNEIDYNE
jgi:hypothetical protein